jgi:uncharacterized membrane protein YeaQ/YmgE (transglycosylase-associated protein family)
MNLLISLVIGGIVGWLASILMKSNAQMGIIANVVIGVLGGLLGHFLAGMLGISASGIGRWIVALCGAMLLIAILRGVGIMKKA